MLSIEERPREVESRSVPGHWEGDLIVGKHKRSALGHIGRENHSLHNSCSASRKDAVSVRRAYAKEFKKLPREIVKTLTYDQGKEMSEHKQFTIDTGIQVYTLLTPVLLGSGAPMKTPMASFANTFQREPSLIKYPQEKSKGCRDSLMIVREPC